MAFLYDTEADYDEAIADTRLALKRAKKIGQEHKSDSGGSMREVKEIDVEALRAELRELVNEREDFLGNTGACSTGASW